MSNPVRVLYVDDYVLDRELVRYALGKGHDGFEITEAASRQEFEARLAEGDYDLVLSDFDILGFEGLDVIDAVRAKDPRLPVIIVTGSGSEQIAVETMKRGAVDYVIKTPQHIRRLPHTIQTALEKKRLEVEHQQALQALRRRDEILKAVAFAAERLLRQPDLETGIPDVLARLGEATGVSRVYIFESHDDERDTRLVSQRHEWVAPGVAPQIDAPELQNFSLLERGFGRWVETLDQGQIVHGPVCGFPPGERKILASQDIQSIIIVPIFAMGKRWGAMSFEECAGERIWSEAEIEVLRTAANVLGAAIQRLRADETLRQAHERLEATLNALPDLLFELDCQGRICDLRAPHPDLLCASPHELLGQTVSQLLSQETACIVMDAIKQAEETGRHIGATYSLEIPSGTRWYELSIAAKGNPKSLHGRLIALVRDITRRVQAQKALQESEARYRAVVEDQTEMISRYKPDSTLTFVNDAFCAFVGKPRQELIGQSWEDLVSGESREMMREHVASLNRENPVASIEQREIRPDGTIRWARWTNRAIFDEDGQLIEYQGTGREITERKRIESQRDATLEALRESEARLRTAVESLPFDFWLMDTDGRYAMQNSCCKMNWGNLIGKRPEQVTNDERIWTLWQRTNQQAFDGQVVECQVEYILAGEKKFYHSIVSPVYDGDQIRAILGVNVDITERVQAENALRRRNRELALLNRASRELNATLDPNQVLITVLEETRRLMDVVACSIWLIDPETDELVCRQITGPRSEAVRGWRLAPGQGLAGWVIQSGQSLIVPDAQSDARHYEDIDKQTGLKLCSILTVPLRGKQSTIGVLQVVDTARDRFQSSDLALLEPLAATATMAIENAQLYAQARQDAETRSVLLREVNHRVKNNLTAIIGLLYTARRHAQVKDRDTYQSTMSELISRVRGLTTVHDMLSASQWSPLCLSDLAAQVIRASLQALPHHKHISVDVSPSPVQVTPDQAHHLALVINELTTNSAKYALQGRDTARITVHIGHDDDTVQCEFRDNGPGYPAEVLRLEHRNIGFDLVQNIVRDNLRGELSLHNDQGAMALIQFKAKVNGK
jgi:PAS domain S-box-containing protein